MESNRFLVLTATLTLMVAAVGFAAVELAEGDAVHGVHPQTVHKIVLDCDENSRQDCERRVHVKVMDSPHHYSYSFGASARGGFLGVQTTELTPELRTHFGVPEDEGVMVAEVVDDSAAFRAGLAAGDIITGIDAESIGSTTDLIHAIRSREDGESISLEIWRDGSVSTVVATLEKLQRSPMAHRTVFIDCEDDAGDCEIDFSSHAIHHIELGCAEGEECDVEIRCDDGDCECTVNGEAIDCPALQGIHHGN